MLFNSEKVLTRLSQSLRALGSYIGVPRFVLAGIANGNQELDSPDSNGLLLVELDVLPSAKSSPPLNCEQRSRARELVRATDAHSEYQPILLCNKDHECRGKTFFRGSDRAVDSASDFHFYGSGFKPRFGNRNFSSIFHHFWNVCTIRALFW